ncbi:MAG TPA: hypothetical protein VGS07_22945 [Thermoanaerobaculia bacterium]|nr:hypothetical protein [Thermoanaerobaculia bacterium]
MDLVKTISGAFALVFLAAVPVRPWNLVECPPEVVETWALPDQFLRDAKPGSPLYLPKPFPRGKDEVLANYVYELQRLLKDTPAESLPSGAAGVLEGLRKKTLRYDVLRIVNWSPTRCGKERRLDAYHLIRVIDARSGLEITRSVLEENGRLGVISSTMDDERGDSLKRQAARLRPPEEEMRSVAARFKIRGEAPQYVTTFGTLRCPNVTPCLAFRGGGHVYVLSYDGTLFEVDQNGRRLEMGKDVGSPEKNEPILKAIGPEGRLVSLGGKVFTTARKVKG